jgi:NitT/TauT family transport system permease protein
MTTAVSGVRAAGAAAARRKSRAVSVGRGVAGALVLVGILEVVSRLELVNPEFLPPFSTVLLKSGSLLVDPSFLVDVGSTLLTWLVAMAICIAIAVPLGILLGLSAVTYRASRSAIELIRPLPAVALIPLVLLVVGQGVEMKVIVALFAALWPVLFNTIYGVHGVDPKAKEMARSFQLGRFAIIRRVVVPGAAPFIATGVRLSSSITLIVIITVELIAGGADGLGAFIAQNRAVGNQVTAVYAGILVTGLLGLVLNLLLGAAERRWLGWGATRR